MVIATMMYACSDEKSQEARKTQEQARKSLIKNTHCHIQQTKKENSFGTKTSLEPLATPLSSKRARRVRSTSMEGDIPMTLTDLDHSQSSHWCDRR